MAEEMNAVFVGLYALGAIAYAVFAFIFCRQKYLENTVIFSELAARVAHQLNLDFEKVTPWRFIVRCGPVKLTPAWPAERCYHFLIKARALQDNWKREAWKREARR